MNNLYFKVASAIGAVAAVSLGAAQTNIQITYNFPTGGPTTSLYDTYAFGATYPSVTTNAVAYWIGNVSNGQTYTVPNPSVLGDSFGMVSFGLYNDANGATHVAVISSNDLKGLTWDSLFNTGGFNSYPEPTIISDLESGNPTDTTALAGPILSYFTSVFPMGGYGVGSSASGNITSFTTGVHIGTATANLAGVPEPSSLLVLGGLLPMCLLRRRR